MADDSSTKTPSPTTAPSFAADGAPAAAEPPSLDQRPDDVAEGDGEHAQGSTEAGEGAPESGEPPTVTEPDVEVLEVEVEPATVLVQELEVEVVQPEADVGVPDGGAGEGDVVVLPGEPDDTEAFAMEAAEADDAQVFEVETEGEEDPEVVEVETAEADEAQVVEVEAAEPEVIEVEEAEADDAQVVEVEAAEADDAQVVEVEAAEPEVIEVEEAEADDAQVVEVEAAEPEVIDVEEAGGLVVEVGDVSDDTPPPPPPPEVPEEVVEYDVLDETPAPQDLRPPIERALDAALEGDPERLEAALAAEVEAESDPQRRALINYELGHLYQYTFDDGDAAVAHYAKALRDDILLGPNVWAIRRNFVSQGAWEKLLNLFNAHLKFEKEPTRRRAELLLEKGWILQEMLGRRSEAKDCFFDAHAADPTWLAPLLSAEKLALAQGDLDFLADVYREMSEAASEPERRVAALLDLARLQEHLVDGTPDQAMAVLEDAFETGSCRGLVLREMERVTSRAQRTGYLVDVLSRQATELARPEVGRPDEAAARLRHGAQLALQQSDDAHEALRLTRAALEILPDDRVLLRDALHLLERLERWEEVAETLARLAEGATTVGERAALHYRRGVALLAAGADPEEALVEAEALLPGYLPAFVLRERRLLASADAAGLAALYEAQAEAVESGAEGLPEGGEDRARWRATGLWQAAFWCRRAGDEPERVERLCQAALAAVPGFLPAQDELERLFRATGQWQKLAELLQARLAAADEEGRLRLLEELAALHGGALSDPEGEVAALRQICAVRPDALAPLRLLAAAQSRQGDHSALAETLAALEQREDNAAAGVAWKLHRAALCDGPLEQPERAAALYREVLALQPDHAFAFAALERLLSRLERWEEQGELLREGADRAPDAEKRLTLLHRLLALHEVLRGDPEKVKEVAAEILAVEPRDDEAAAALQRAAEATSDEAHLAEALQLRADQAEDPALGALLLLRLAEVQGAMGAGDAQVEETLLAALQRAPERALVLDAVETVAMVQLARGDQADAATRLAQLEELVPEEERPAVLEERASLAAVLGETGQADELWLQVLQEQPERRTALWGRLRTCGVRRDVSASAELLDRLARLSGDPAVEAALLLRAGLQGISGGGDPEEVRGRLERVLELQPGRAEALLGLLALPAEPAVRARRLEALRQSLPEGAGQDELRMPLALAREEAGELAAAAEELAALLQDNPSDRGALVALQRVLRAAGQREPEAKVWIRLAGLLEDPAQKADAYAEAAEILAELDRGEEAALLFRHVLAQRPEDEEAYRRVKAIYEQFENYAELDLLLDLRCKVAGSDEEQVELLLEQASLRLDKLEDRAGAGTALLRLLQLDPRHVSALEQLARLHDEDGNAEAAVKRYRTLLEATTEAEDQRPAVWRLAELLGTSLGRPREAADVCLAFLELVPADEELLVRLSELAFDLSDHTLAVDALQRLDKVKEDRLWRAANLRRIAGLQQKELGDGKAARDALLKARELDPVDVEVVGDLVRVNEALSLKQDNDRLLERAKDDIRAALAEDPLSGDLLRRLLRVADLHEDRHAELAVLGALCAVGEAERAEVALYQRRAAMVGYDPKGTPPSELWRGAGLSRQKGQALTGLWSVVAEAVPKMFEGQVPAGPSAFNVGRGQRVDRRAGGPVSSLLDPIAGLIGLNDYEIYVSGSDADLVGGVDSERPVLVTGYAVVAAMDHRGRFRLGRTLALLQHRASALDLLSRDQVELVLSAAIAQVAPEAPLELPRERVSAEAKRLYRALSRKARKALPEAVQRHLQNPAPLGQWADEVLAEADRVGLLVGGEIVAALSDLLDGFPALDALAAADDRPGRRALKDNARGKGMLLYSLDAGYLALRREMGI